jgi:CheY-like chemotaxis protein/nitrogen-specific signal transduction histidine kinase/HPt (histidine-containing phosphotransfer) domain-containing protein
MEKKKDQDSSSLIYTDVLLELSPNVVIFLSPEDMVITMSRAARLFFNAATLDEVKGKHILNLITNPVLTLLVKKWFEKMNKGMELDETFPLDINRNDQYQWFNVRATNVSNEGRVVGKVFFITETTELYSQKKILDTIMNSFPGDILVFDRSLQILLASETVAHSGGFHSWRDVVGHSLHDLVKLDLGIIEGMLNKIILNDEPVHQIIKYARADNELRWFYADLRTIKSTAGTFGYILTQLDITGEIKPKAILEALMDSSSDAIAITNPEGIVEFASRSLVESLGGSDWRSVINRPWSYLFRNRSALNGGMSEMFSNDLSVSKKGSFDVDTPDGKAYFNYRVDPLDYQNENFGQICIASNTTELVAARDRAESAVRAKAAFLANMSHELRTPMNAVIGMNELLARTALNSQQKNYLAHIRSSATMLLSIINDILDFSRIEDRKLELSNASYNISSLLHDVINLVAIKVAEKELSFTVDLDPSLPSVLIGDEIRVKQILINLLNNAVKFTDQGEVNLSVSAIRSANNKTVLLSFRVKDTGIGIPKAKQSELFERFSRIENPRNAAVEGSGLGLAICKGLVALMNGSLRLESDEGAGSVFIAEIVQEIGLGSEPLAVFRYTSPVSVLVYDKDVSTLASIRQMCAYARVQALLCSDSEEFNAHISGKTFEWTHVVFEYKTGYARVSEVAASRPGVHWLALLSMTDFIGQGKISAVDFIFKPLVLPTFARFIQGEHVDFGVSLPMLNSLGVTPYYFRTNGVRVLVVDDSAVNRKVAEGFLQTLDIQVDEAESGEDAIRKAETASYDLILMDHMMPGMDGVEAAGRIRKIPGYATVPIIALTGNTGEMYLEMYRSAGMNDMLYKPIEFNAFVVCLKKWLPQKKRVDVSADGSMAAADASQPYDGSAWIPGLDRQTGLEYTGSQKNLDMILKVFNRTAPKMLEQLESGRHSGNPGIFRTSAHSMVSSIANIGGVSLSARAKELEQAIIAGNVVEVDRLYGVVHEELENLIASVAKHFADAEKGEGTK